MATVAERLERVEADLAVIRADIERIARQLAYLDTKTDQTATVHWDLVDELTGTFADDEGPGLEPDDGDLPEVSERTDPVQPERRAQVA